LAVEGISIMTSIIRAIALSVIIVAPCAATAQERERVIDWEFEKPNLSPQIRVGDEPFKPTDMEALAIIGIYLDKKVITMGQPFAAADDWLKGFKMRVKNVSGKTIVRASFHFSFPEARNGDAVLGSRLMLSDDNDFNGPVGERKAILPGGEFELTYTEKRRESERRWVAETTGVVSITRVLLNNAVVKFEDGEWWTGWPRIKNASAAPKYARR
jgi:hypothetical protein